MKLLSSVVYVCGYGRSGSTLLDTYLSERLGLLSTGELTHLPKAAANRCGCGVTVAECELWSGVVSDARIGSYSARVESLAAGGDAAAFVRYWETVLEATQLAGWPTIVDSSKSAWRQARRLPLLARTGADVTPILLWRPFSGVFSSRLSAYERQRSIRPRRSSRLLIGLETALSWTVANVIGLRLVERYGNGTVIGFDELISERDEVVRNVEVAPTRRTWANHSVAGNRMRLGSSSTGTTPQALGVAYWLTRPLTLTVERALRRRSTRWRSREPLAGES